MKYLGIDYGKKKVGFAQSDDDGILAFPLMISPNDKNLFKDTLELIREMKFGVVVIGESLDGKGKANEIAKEARGFGSSLESSMDIRLVYEKEWYSSVEARTNPSKKGDHEVDDEAAAIILQRYLDRANGPRAFEEDMEEYKEEEEDKNTDSW